MKDKSLFRWHRLGFFVFFLFFFCFSNCESSSMRHKRDEDVPYIAEDRPIAWIQHPVSFSWGCWSSRPWTVWFHNCLHTRVHIGRKKGFRRPSKERKLELEWWSKNCLILFHFQTLWTPKKNFFKSYSHWCTRKFVRRGDRTRMTLRGVSQDTSDNFFHLAYNIYFEGEIRSDALHLCMGAKGSLWRC